MPTYEVKTPDGRVLEIMGDQPPSEDQIQQITSQAFAGQTPQWPELTEQATLPEILRQPTPRTGPWRGGVVRAALPGMLQPEDLLPAVRKIGGELSVGEKGDTHPDIIDRDEIPAEDLDQRGFVGPAGEFYDRETAARVAQLPTEREPGRAHSTDLSKAQRKAALGKPKLGLDWTIAQLPTAIFGSKEEDLLRAEEIAESGKQFGPLKPIPGLPSEQNRLAQRIEDDYRQQLRLLPWDTDPRTANIGAAKLEQERNQRLADIGITSVDVAARARLGEPLTPAQQQTLLGKGTAAKAVGAAQREVQGFATALVQPEMIAMAPGVGAVEQRLLPLGDRLLLRLAGKPTPMVQAGKVIGHAYLPIMAEQFGEKAVDTVKNVAKGDLDAAVESGVGALATGLMVALPVYSIQRAGHAAAYRRAYLATSDSLAKELDGLNRKLEGDLTPQQRIDALQQRADLQQRLDLRESLEGEVDQAFKDTGVKHEITDKDLGRGIVAKRNSDGSISINRNVLHRFLEFETRSNPKLASRVIQSMVNQEVIHAAIPDSDARDYWKSLSFSEKKLVESLYPFEPGTPAHIKGQEAVRMMVEFANGLTPAEFFQRTGIGQMKARTQVALLRAIASTRESLSLRGKSAANLSRQLEILNNAQQKIIDTAKGITDASQKQAPAEIHGDVRPQPVAGAREVSAQVRSQGFQPPSQAVAQAAQVPLTPQAPPVEKQAPPTAPTAGAPAAAPAPVAAKAEGVAAPSAVPAISTTTPKTEAAQAPTVKQPEPPAVERDRLLREMHERTLTQEETDRLDDLMDQAPSEGPAMRMPETPKEIADELGGVWRASWGGRDYYEFPPAKPGQSREQVAVPSGTGIEEVRRRVEASRARFEEGPAMRMKGVTEENIDRLPIADQMSLGHEAGIEYGLKLSEADVPRLEQKYKQEGAKQVNLMREEFQLRKREEAGEELSAMDRDKYNDAMSKQKAAFARMNFYGGALMGATRGKHPISGSNYVDYLRKTEMESGVAMRMKDWDEQQWRNYWEPMRAALKNMTEDQKRDAWENIRLQMLEGQKEPELTPSPETEMGVEPAQAELPTPTPEHIQFWMEDYLRSPIETRALKEASTAKGAVRVEYDRPNFNTFVQEMRRNFPGVTATQLRSMWLEKVWEHLINAPGDRIADWRLGMKLEGKYGTRAVPDPTIVQEWETKDGRRRLVTRMVKPTREQAMEEIAALDRMTDSQRREYLKKKEKNLTSARNYRYKLITEIADRLLQESEPDKVIGKMVTVDDIDFAHSRTKVGAYYSFIPEETRNLRRLNEVLDDQARVKNRTITFTKRLTVLVNKATGDVDLVSTYRHGRKKQLMIYDPSGPVESTEKNHVPLEDILKTHQVKASILLDTPVQNFQRRISEAPDGRSAEKVYMDLIGKEAEARELGFQELWQQINEESRIEARIQQLPEDEQQNLYLMAAHSGRPVHEVFGELVSTEPLPKTAVEEGEGAMFTGPHATIARAQAGILRANVKRHSRGPMTGNEAGCIIEFFAKMEPRSVGDVVEALKTLHLKQAEVLPNGKRRGLRGEEYSAMVAIDKAVMQEYRRLLRSDAEKSAELKKPSREGTYEEQKQSRELEAMYNALAYLYNTSTRHSFPRGEPLRYETISGAKTEFQRYGYDPDQAIPEILARYGDRARSAFESIAEPEKPKARPRIGVTRELEIPEGRWSFRRRAIPSEGGLTTRGRVYEPTEPARLTPEEMAHIEAQPVYRTEGRLTPFGVVPGKMVGGPRPYPTERGLPESIYGRPTGKIMRYETRGLETGPGERVVTEERVRKKGHETVLDPETRTTIDLSKLPPERRSAVARRLGLEEEGPAMRMRGYGAARRYIDERVESGRALPIAPGTGLSSLESRENGMRRLKAGEDPEKAMAGFEATQRYNDQDMELVVARAFDLQRQADRILDRVNNPENPEYQQAKQALNQWEQRMAKMREIWHRTGQAQQGEMDVDTGSFHAMEREHRETTGEDFSPKQARKARELAKKSLEAEAEADAAKESVFAKANEVKLEPQIKSLVDQIIESLDRQANDALARIRKRRAEGRMYSAITPIPPEELFDYAIYGAAKISKLALQGARGYARWQKEMLAELGEHIKPNLKQVWDESVKLQQAEVDKIAGKEPAYAPVRQAVTRPDPARGASLDNVRITVARKAYGKYTPEQARAVWNYTKKAFLDRGETDFEVIRSKLAMDLGISMEDVYRLLAANKTMRVVTDKMYQKMADRRRVVMEAKNWLKNQQYPLWLQWARRVPRVFFIDKVFGHGTVGLITHAGNMVFDPRAWKVYFPAWIDMYRMVFSGKYHERRMADLKLDKNFITARRAGLVNDPFRYADDYQVMALTRFFSGMIGNRGFDALKTLRQARFNQLWNATPENLKTPEMAKLWADSVNHATGVVKSSFGIFGEAANWTFFAPKLEASRWAWMIKDPARAAYIFSRWDRATPEQRLWAKSELKSKAWVFGSYLSLLAMNDGLLRATNSDQEINWDNPRRSDFLAFKVAGFNVGIISPLIGMLRLFADLLYYLPFGERKGVKSLEPRPSAAGRRVWEYGTGKLSPFSHFAWYNWMGADFRGRPMPWRSDRVPAYIRREGLGRYEWPEYIAETVAPIPAEEVIKEVWHNQGMSDSNMDTAMRILKTAGEVGLPMAATGIRLTEDVNQ